MQEYQKNLVIVTYITIFSLVIPAIFWLSSRQQQTSLYPQDTVKAFTQGQLPEEKFKNSDIAERISVGEKILITASQNPDKQAAAQAFAVGDYTKAATKYNSSLQIQPNDPEALIYFNNAKAALNQKTVTIAIGVPIGGNLNVAKEMLRGIAQAQQEINRQGGINGNLVQVKIANDDNDPEIVQEVATELVKDQSVLAVIGHNASRASFAAAPIYQEGELVMITSTSSAENLPEVSDYIFRSTPSTRALADVLAEYALDSARKNYIGICADSKEEASTSFKEEFTWSVYRRGAKIANIECDFAAPDFNPTKIPSAMVSNGADALLLAPSIYKIGQAIQVAKANQSRLSLLGNHSMNSYAVLNEGQANVNGMVLSVAWHPGENPKNSFTQDALKLWGGAVNWRTAMTYDATKIALTGLQSASTREQLQQTLANREFSAQGANEKIQFLPSGDRKIRGTLIKIEPGERSKTGYDFVAYQSYIDSPSNNMQFK